MDHELLLQYLIRTAPLLMLGSVYLQIFFNSFVPGPSSEVNMRRIWPRYVLALGMTVLAGINEWLFW